MSAFIVTHDHINAIISFASQYNIAGVAGREQAIAELLLAENTRSVNHRYRENTPVETIVFSSQDPTLSPIEVIKACDCLDYQSCETDDWHSTPACKLLESILSHAVRQLDGYENAAWEIQ